MQTALNWTRVNNDTYGNPRYVVHFLALLTPAECADKGYARYDQACARARKIGGRKYRAPSYGGGIVFTSYNLRETEEHIARVLGEVLA